MRIGILAEKRYLSQAQPAGLLAALEAAGHEAVLADPQASAYALDDGAWTGKLDLVVARGRSSQLLSLLGWAEARGLRTVNRRSAIASVHNKADMAVLLAGAGLPTPRTFLGPVRELPKLIPAALYPVILKPVFGDNGRGLRLAHTREELESVQWPEPAALAQRYLPGDGRDLKLYCIGGEVWAVRKPSPFVPAGGAGSTEKAELVPLTRELEDLGRRLGRLFGLELYGADCIETPEGPSVIEVNDYPNYTAVPDADRKLAAYVTGARAGAGPL